MLPNLSGLSNGDEVPTEGLNEVLPKSWQEHLRKPDTNPNPYWREYKNNYRKLLGLPMLQAVYSWNRYRGPVNRTQQHEEWERARDEDEPRLEKVRAELDAHEGTKGYVTRKVSMQIYGSIQQRIIGLEDLIKLCERSKDDNQRVLSFLARKRSTHFPGENPGDGTVVSWQEFLREILEDPLIERVPGELLELRVLVLKFVLHVLNTANPERDPAQTAMVRDLVKCMTDERFDVYSNRTNREPHRPVLELILVRDDYSTPLASELTNLASAITETMYQMYHPEVQKWFVDGMREAYGLERDATRPSDHAVWYKGRSDGSWLYDRTSTVANYIDKKAEKWERVEDEDAALAAYKIMRWPGFYNRRNA